MNLLPALVCTSLFAALLTSPVESWSCPTPSAAVSGTVTQVSLAEYTSREAAEPYGIFDGKLFCEIFKAC